MKVNIPFIIMLLFIFSTLFDITESKDKKKKNKKDKKKKSTKNKNKRTAFPSEPSSVIELTHNNTSIFRENQNGRFLIMFYDNFEKSSKEMNSVFNKLSLLKGRLDGFKFLRVNSKKMTNFADQIGGFVENPALFLVCNDQDMVFHYDGPKNIESIVHYVHRMIKIKIQEIKSPEDFEEKKKKGSNILFVGDSNKFKNAFNSIAKYSKKFFTNAFWTNSEYYFNKFNIKREEMDAVAFFTINGKLNDGERMNFSPDELQKETILKLSEIYSRKPFTLLSHYKLEMILEHKLRAIFVLYSDDQSERNTLVQEQIDGVFKELSLKYREEYWFLKTNLAQTPSSVIAEAFHLSDKSELPLVGLLDNKKTGKIDYDIYKYKNTKITKESLEEFITNHKEGKLKRMIISESDIKENLAQSVEDSENGIVQTNASELGGINTITGLMVEQSVFRRPGKDVVLFICSDSPHCAYYKNIFGRVTEKLMNNDQVFFATINSILNEVPGIDFKTVPALALVPDISKNTEKKVLLYDGPHFRTAELIHFIQENVSNPIKEVLNTPQDDQNFSDEHKAKTQYISREEDEEKANMHEGNIGGNGFARIVHRFFTDTSTSGDNRDEYGLSDHDREDYDFDPEEEQGFYAGRLKSDL